jgi:hypothetical protein
MSTRSQSGPVETGRPTYRPTALLVWRYKLLQNIQYNNIVGAAREDPQQGQG